MKKIKYVFTAMLVTLLALTGCSKKNSLSPSEALSKASKNVKESQNYKMNMEITTGMSMGEELSFNLNVTGESKVDVTNGITYTLVKMNVLGNDVTTETYSDTKSETGKLITYTKSNTDDEWYKTILDFDLNESNMQAFLSDLATKNNIKEIKDDKDNYNYEIVIPSDSINSIIGSVGSEGLTVPLEGDVAIKVSVDKKTGNYSKIYMDMKDVMKKSMEKSGVATVNISDASISITISDYNNAGSVTIPSEALEAKIVENLDDDSELINEFSSDDFDEILTCKVNTDKIEDEITFGFTNGKYAKAVEEVNHTFETEEEAEKFYDEHVKAGLDNEAYYHFDKEVNITTWIDPEENEKDYSIADVKAMMEKDGYICE